MKTLILFLLILGTYQASAIVAAELDVQPSTLMTDDVCLGEDGQAFPHCQVGFVQTRAHSTNEKMTKRDSLSEMSLMMSSTELAELQMFVASAWVEEDSLFDESDSADSGSQKLLRPPTYQEFELGATANLGSGTDFWHPGMREWINAMSNANVSEGPTMHIQWRRKIGARMFIAETDEQDGWIQDNVSQYAATYMRELKHRTSILVSDVSKSGGVEFCKCGFQAGCRGDPTHNLQCTAGLPSAKKTNQELLSKASDCGRLSRWHEKYSITLQDLDTRDLFLKAAKKQQHFPLINGGLCHEFWNVIVLRDPINRLVAQLSLLNMTGKSEIWNPHHVTPQILFDTVPIISNNFYIRSLIGAKGFQLPFNATTEEHLEEAKHILEGFDLVLMKTSSLRDELYGFMGWDCDHHEDKPERAAVPFVRGYFERLIKLWSLDQWQKVREANNHDFQLVKYARQLDRLDKKVFRHPYFTYFAHSIQYKSCQNATGTCGYMCK